jgi:uncharacterized protein HemY
MRFLAIVLLSLTSFAAYGADQREIDFTQDEWTYRVTESGQQRYQLDGVARIESNVQSGQTFGQ